MMKTTKKNLLLMLIGIAVVTGCKKEDGPAGPAGKDGNANVKSQTTIISTWYYDASNYYLYADISVPAITQSIFDNGAVLVYLKTSAGDWAPLPRTIYINTSYSTSQRYVYYPGNLRIIIQDSDLTQPLDPGSLTLKIVCVASSVMIAHPKINEYSYSELIMYFPQ